MPKQKPELAIPGKSDEAKLGTISGKKSEREFHVNREPSEKVRRQLEELGRKLRQQTEPMEVVGMRTTKEYNPYGEGVVDRSRRVETGAADLNIVTDNTRSGAREAAEKMWKRPSQIPMDNALDVDLDPELAGDFKPGDIERAA